MRPGIRFTGIILGITALLLMAPTVCAASMGTIAMGAPAQEATSPCSSQGVTTEPCFTTSSGSLSHCVLIRAMGEQVKPSRLISYDNVCLSSCLITTSVDELSQIQASSCQTEILKIPISEPTEHHCRNLLSSEEPPL